MLGHLTRTLALAEEFDAQGHEVFVAANRAYSSLTAALPSGIRVLRTPEMFASATQSFGPIRRYDEDLAADRENLESANRLSKSELRRRGKRLAEMVARDAEIVEEARPDVIVTDYRFTTQLLKQRPRAAVFHISHLLGYPSFHRRVTGSYFFPLDLGAILAPGIESIEYASPDESNGRETLCGIFRWRGWRRIHRDAPDPPRSEVLLFFGSTGNGRRIVPWMLRRLPESYRVSAIASGLSAAGRRGACLARSGHLERFLQATDVVFCHGGHGTVMECILHKTPMALFPNNIEQLEIGRRMEKLRLGILVKRPYAELSETELGEIVERLRADQEMKSNLAKFSALLSRQDGPKRAVATVVRSLACA